MFGPLLGCVRYSSITCNRIAKLSETRAGAPHSDAGRQARPAKLRMGAAATGGSNDAWLDRYAFSLATAAAYVVAAVVIACAQRSRTQGGQTWALRKWVWRCLLVSCVCRVLMFVLQLPLLPCSDDPVTQVASRAALVSLQGLAFSLNWASFTLLVVFFEEVRRSTRNSGQGDRERAVRRVRCTGVAVAVVGGACAFGSCLYTFVFNLERSEECIFWIQVSPRPLPLAPRPSPLARRPSHPAPRPSPPTPTASCTLRSGAAHL